MPSDIPARFDGTLEALGARAGAAPASPRFDNSYARLPDRFYARQPPSPVASPQGVRVNHALARHLGIDPGWLESPEGVEVIAGNRIPEGAEPIAMAYSGHQYGHFNPSLGDGRALLLGEVIGADGLRWDIHLKGSGRTPYSRNGDGRSPLGPVLREYVVSEAMGALGIPTTRSLAAVTTGELVVRDRPLPGGVLARVAKSHVRIGTLERFAALRDHDALRVLVEYVIARHYPDDRDAEVPARALLDRVVAAQAELIARWQHVGFIHGVMNTDNALLSGETIDFGPCAFMDAYHPETVYSSIDHGGRYAYGKQPQIAEWNLTCLAQALVPLLGPDRDAALASARESLAGFADVFNLAHLRGLRRKIGLDEARPGDEELLRDLFALMTETRADFTLTFRRLADLAHPEDDGLGVADVYELPDAFTPWLRRWQARAAAELSDSRARREAMRRTNPVVVPRNHCVEEALRAAEDHDDFGPFHALVEVVARPFEIDPQARRYALPPRPEQVVHETFCGT